MDDGLDRSKKWASSIIGQLEAGIEGRSDDACNT